MHQEPVVAHVGDRDVEQSSSDLAEAGVKSWNKVKMNMRKIQGEM